MGDDTIKPLSAEEFDRIRLLERFKSQTPAHVPAVSPAANPNPTDLLASPAPTPAPSFNFRPFAGYDTSLPIELQAFDPIFGFDNLVDVHYFLYPDINLHTWQAEELLRISGYTNGKLTGKRIHWFKHQPYIAAHPCANGSGKDKIILATALAGLPLLYRDVYSVATSSSHEQLKNQTQNHLRRGIETLNSKLGFKFYDAVEFYVSCKERGAEIKLFATDEPGRAEGWHPLTPQGRLFIAINETKSIPGDMLDAFDRCRGYSHWLEISSPGMRVGTFYSNVKSADKYPEVKEARPFRYFSRKVTAYDCPHITKEEIEFTIAKKSKSINGRYIIETSINANFAEASEDVVIPFGLVEQCSETKHEPGVIGIGLDCAAGGDETVVCVRNGNKLIDLFAFTEADTTVAVDRIDSRLDAYRNSNYIFNGDDGGVGRGMLDMLINKGWSIYRRHNQSAAFNKRKFLNLGAEMYFHVRDLFEARNIVAPTDDTLLTQLCTRRDNQQEGQGKHKLESKKKLRGEGIQSPDRADAFVLCFFSHPLTPAGTPAPSADTSNLLSAEDLVRLSIENPAKFAAFFSRTPTQLSDNLPTILRK